MMGYFFCRFLHGNGEKPIVYSKLIVWIERIKIATVKGVICLN